MQEAIVPVSICVFFACLASSWWLLIYRPRTANKLEFQRHRITPDELRAALFSNPRIRLFALHDTLDIPEDTEIIAGAAVLFADKVLINPWLLPKDVDAVAYSHSDEASRLILERVIPAGFLKLKILIGGIDAWKAKGFPVERYLRAVQKMGA